MAEIAKRWGYDFDERVFRIHLRDDVLAASCKVECSTDSGKSTSLTIVTAPGLEISIPIEASEGEGVRARFVRYGIEVDSVWVRTAKVTCPHCGKRVDQEASE